MTRARRVPERWCACARGSRVHSTHTSAWQSRHSDCTASCGCAAHATGAARMAWSAAAAADEEDDEEDDEEEEEEEEEDGDSIDEEKAGERVCAALRPDAERWRFSCGSVVGDDDALRCVAVGDFGPLLGFEDEGVDGTITTLILPVLVLVAPLPAVFDPGADEATPMNDALAPLLLWLRFIIEPPLPPTPMVDWLRTDARWLREVELDSCAVATAA
jgi:hypothetical protein